MKITVYSITECPFCKQEKDFLNAQGLQFEEKNVQENREFLTEMLEKSDKFAGVPFTIIEKDGGEKVNLKGFTQSEFEQALGLSSASGAVVPPATPAPVAEPVDMPVASSMPDPALNMPSMPGIDEAPQNPSMGSSTQTPEPTMPAEPVVPAMPAAPTEAAPANPQNQLDGLLADLQTKSQPDLPDFNAPASPDGTSQQQ